MKTQIYIYERANEKNIVVFGSWNRILTEADIRSELSDMMRYLDPKKFSHRVIIIKD